MPDRLNKAFEEILEGVYPDSNLESQRDACQRTFHDGCQSSLLRSDRAPAASPKLVSRVKFVRRDFPHDLSARLARH
jgi:hypothetical protein